MSRIKQLAATALVAIVPVVGVLSTGAGVAAAEVPSGLPPKSCLGQINANGNLLLGETPRERAYAYANPGQFEQDQLACQTAAG